jgi:peptidoglycan/LPS O-acetylase OafA/YrhL
MTSPKEHIPFLDYIRGVAILAVFVYHAISPTEPRFLELKWHGWFRDFNAPFLSVFPATLGWVGVAIFFVVSGFCIHLSHEKSRDKDFGVFFLRRFFRIYPPYLVSLLFFAFIFPWSKLDFSRTLLHTHSHLFYSLVSLAAHLTLTHNFSDDFAWTINGPFWSIAVEVQLYLLYPLLLFVARRSSWKQVLWMTAAIELSMRALSGIPALSHWTEPAWFSLNPLFFWFSWSTGAALAEAYLKKQPLPFSNASLYLFPALFLAFYFFKPLFPFCFTLAALSTAYIISYLLRRPEEERASPSGFSALFYNQLRFAGLISYSLYLMHDRLLTMVFHVATALYPTPNVPFLIMFGICLASWFVILIPAYLFYLLVERPSIACGKYFIGKWRGRKAAADASPVVVIN